MSAASSDWRSLPPLPRHTLAWPAPAARDRLLAQACDAGARGAIARWLAAAWPLVARRVDLPVAQAPGEVALGLPLPRDEGRRRLAFVLPRRLIARHAAPLPLSEVADALPHEWHAPLAALDCDARAVGVTLRVFGSAAWQALTGRAYLHERSDLDVVVQPDSPSQLDATLALFDAWEARTGRRIDAEIIFTHGRAVAWREWRQTAGADARVLAKSVTGAALVARGELLASLVCVPA